jgi:hypothetical protein
MRSILHLPLGDVEYISDKELSQRCMQLRYIADILNEWGSNDLELSQVLTYDGLRVFDIHLYGNGKIFFNTNFDFKIHHVEEGFQADKKSSTIFNYEMELLPNLNLAWRRVNDDYYLRDGEVTAMANVFNFMIYNI